MKVVIIGTGNTATVLGKKLRLAGHNIVQVFGRDSSDASALAYELDTESTNYWNVVNRAADLYIIAVSDFAVGEIIKELNFPEKTVVHTAASVSIDIFKEKADHYGILYPLQTLSKNSKDIPDVPFIIDASDPKTLLMLDELAHTMSNQVVRANDIDRVKLHLAAVFCNNFVNHLYSLAENYCIREGLDFRLLQPLILETAMKIQNESPANVQTGPAERHDEETIQTHMILLAKYPHLQEIYSVITGSIANSGNL